MLRVDSQAPSASEGLEDLVLAVLDLATQADFEVQVPVDLEMVVPDDLTSQTSLASCVKNQLELHMESLPFWFHEVAQGLRMGPVHTTQQGTSLPEAMSQEFEQVVMRSDLPWSPVLQVSHLKAPSA